jgi:predicted PurR-regulated permease PerM
MKWGFEGFGGQRVYAQLIELGQILLENTYTVLVYIAFIAILVVFVLPEVLAFREKLRVTLDAERHGFLETIDEIAVKVRQYLGVTAVTSLITGVTSALWALVLGLDLALVWGALNFLLNFVPIIGNIIGTVLPSIYAVIQFQSLAISLIAFAGFAILQIITSSFVYPALQGRSLSLSPAAIVVALAFWGWVWGIAGTLIAVPLTVAIVIVCQHFHSTKWIAHLLSTDSK